MTREAVRRIVAATDFSQLADRALEVAAQLAGRVGARVRLVHSEPAIEDPGFGDVPPRLRGYATDLRNRVQGWTNEASRELEERARRLFPDLEVELRLCLGLPASEIVAEARAWDADLIVLGTHGRGPLGRALLGGVAHEVLREAPCPVLLVGPRAVEDVPRAVARPTVDGRTSRPARG